MAAKKKTTPHTSAPEETGIQADVSMAEAAESASAVPTDPAPESAASQETHAASPDGEPTELFYRVVSPLRHNGQRYQVGDLVNLTGDQAARLLGLRVVTDQAVEG